ncbi:copper(I)-binding protein [Catenulispora sp. GP43]|uniref:copper chaperone PCu(A)C n=1 Tax=Catenulispora sp. GP43 TaxID=3156263 RepID=UPI00351904B1
MTGAGPRLSVRRWAVVRAAAAPVLAAAVALILLTGWVAAGRAGTSRPVQVSDGWILVPSSPATTAAFFTVRNPGDVPDTLLQATSTVSSDVELSRHLHVGSEGRPEPTASLAIPARGELRMAPLVADIVIANPPDLHPGQRITVTLRFRHSGTVTVSAVAIVPEDLDSRIG